MFGTLACPAAVELLVVSQVVVFSLSQQLISFIASHTVFSLAVKLSLQVLKESALL